MVAGWCGNAKKQTNLLLGRYGLDFCHVYLTSTDDTQATVKCCVSLPQHTHHQESRSNMTDSSQRSLPNETGRSLWISQHPPSVSKRSANKKLFTLLDLCVSSLRRGHANLLCIVPILTDDPRRESNMTECNNGGHEHDCRCV
jgi:hypothetical protein